MGLREYWENLGKVLNEQLEASMTAPDGSDPNSEEERAKLLGKKVPHETGGFMRMFRGGMKPETIEEVMSLPSLLLVQEMKHEITQENEAHHDGRPIHCPVIHKGVK